MTMETISYDPPIEEHPDYVPETPDIEVDDVVDVLAYSGARTIRSNGGGAAADREVLGQEKFLSDGYVEANDSPYVQQFTVKAVRGEKVKVQYTSLGEPHWIPRDMIVDVNHRATAEYLRKRRRRAQRAKRIRERVTQTDLDQLMDVVKRHARKVCSDVWNDTIDPDRADWFWNKRLRSSAGMCYTNSYSSPKGVGGPAIGLAPNYYYLHGTDELLAVVRHELIHLWQVLHPDGGTIGHGPKFRQWIDDLDTHRHCNHWSGATVRVDGDDVIVDGKVKA